MKALVTGGAGFIGSAVCRLLLHEGWDVRVADNFLSGFPENVAPDVELREGDVRDERFMNAACDGIDVVFHQAAIRSVPKSVEAPMAANDVNVSGTLSVLLAAEAAGVRRVVYASSSSVYGDNEAPKQSEDLPPNPISPYAVSKLAGELYSRVWTRIKGLSTVSLRYFNVYGPGQHPESKYAAVFPAFIAAVRANVPPVVHWDGGQERDFTYVQDVARANLLAAAAGSEVDGEVFNIGGGSTKTVLEVLETVQEVLGTQLEPAFEEKRKGDVRRTAADIRKAALLLGWQPEAAWQDSVRATVEWFADTGR